MGPFDGRNGVADIFTTNSKLIRGNFKPTIGKCLSVEITKCQEVNRFFFFFFFTRILKCRLFLDTDQSNISKPFAFFVCLILSSFRLNLPP